nr:hypothetical protein [Amycolatopsis sp. WAC 04197]
MFTSTPEIVVADPLRIPAVQPRAQMGQIPVGLDHAHGGTRLVGGVHRLPRVGEHGHHPVAEPLDDTAAVPGDDRLGHLGDLPQQLQHAVVARLQRPGRKADEVGEQHGDAVRGPRRGAGAADGLPCLDRGQPQLAGGAGPVGTRLGEQAGEPIGRASRRRRQWLGVPGDESAQEPRAAHQLTALVRRAQEPAGPEVPRLRSFGHDQDDSRSPHGRSTCHRGDKNTDGSSPFRLRVTIRELAILHTRDKIEA